MGIAIGLGILSITILAIIVAKIYYKFFPAKSEIEKQKDIMKSYYESSPNILLMNRKDYYPQSEKIKSQIKKQEQIYGKKILFYLRWIFHFQLIKSILTKLVFLKSTIKKFFKQTILILIFQNWRTK